MHRGRLKRGSRRHRLLGETELLEQELFLDFGSVNTVGFYGPEVISTLKIRTARHYCTWVSMYVRQRGTSFEKGYELRKYEPLKLDYTSPEHLLSQGRFDEIGDSKTSILREQAETIVAEMLQTGFTTFVLLYSRTN